MAVPVAVTHAMSTLTAADLFSIANASNVTISTDGRWIAYVQSRPDIMTDSVNSSLWIIEVASGKAERIADDGGSPIWSPDEDRLAFTAPDKSGHTQLYVLNANDKRPMQVTHLSVDPQIPAWSPDGMYLAFKESVRAAQDPSLPLSVKKPDGAHWAEPLQVMDWGHYLSDSSGFMPHTSDGSFVVPSTGGAVRAVLIGPWRISEGLNWTADARSIVISATQQTSSDNQRALQHLYRVDVSNGRISQLTDAQGDDSSPAISIDGKHIAFIRMESNGGDFDWLRLMVMDMDGSHVRQLGAALDRDMAQPRWFDANTILVRYDNHGIGRLARLGLNGSTVTLVSRLGGDESYAVTKDGAIAYQAASRTGPADVWIKPTVGAAHPLTHLNDEVLRGKTMAEIRPLAVRSSADGKKVGTWLILPPGYRAGQRYPMILLIHGGPHGSDGDDWELNSQLLAAAGYVVVDPNYRGSTSYGNAFAATDIFHNFPGPAYADLMSAVDAAVAEGYADPERLFVTGSSAGGELTAWIIGKTKRFRAAVAEKPVTDVSANELSTDQYLASSLIFGVQPWENHELFWSHSAISMVGHVTTPTMIMVGENDHRTPITQSLEFYNALRLQGIPCQLVVVPGASHESLQARPSQHAAEYEALLSWFARYGGLGVRVRK